jgi:hypothetical protein
MTVSILSFREACEAIVANRKAPALNYAVDYATHGLTVTDPHEMKIQALYILNNITRWRGTTAKGVRQTLKTVAKGA